MQFLRRRYESSPEFARIAPFAVFVLLTFVQGQGPTSYWIYLLKTLIGGWMIWEAKPYVETLLRLEPNFTVERFGQLYPLKKEIDREIFKSGLRAAGIPDK